MNIFELSTACLIYGEGWNVLVCNGPNGCPIAMHKSCMACPPGFDSTGNFRCHYCLFVQSVEELDNAKSKVLTVRRALSMLSVGTGGGKKCCDEPKVQGIKTRMMPQQEEDGEQVEKMQGMSSSDRAWIAACIICGKGLNALECNGCPIAMHRSCMACPPWSDTVGNFYCPYCLYKQSMEELKTVENKALTARRALFTLLNGTTGGKKDCDKPKIQGTKKRTMQLQEEDGGQVGKKKKIDGDKLQTATEIVGTSQKSISFDAACGKNKTVGRGDVDDMHKKPRRGRCFKQPVGSSKEESSGMKQFEFEDSSDNKTTVTTQRSMQMYAPSSDGKRKRLKWTSEEEEMLKRGGYIHSYNIRPFPFPAVSMRPFRPIPMDMLSLGDVGTYIQQFSHTYESTVNTQAVVMFSSHPKKNIPWRKMLDYGCNVFDGTRTSSDLKDKWKLILKREAIRRAAMGDPLKSKDIVEDESTSL